MMNKEDRYESSGGATIFHEVVLRQTLQTCRACKALGENETDSSSKPVSLFWRPLVDILQ
jgi:hypothetical protein